jgi:transcriptional regulator with XRE-family HTH domain
MVIADRLRALREEKKLSQGDIEKRTGLLRCYISRVENGHTVPAVETLEKMARATEIPMYQLFYDGEKPPELPNLPKRKSSDDIACGSTGKDARYLGKLRRSIGIPDRTITPGLRTIRPGYGVQEGHFHGQRVKCPCGRGELTG